MKHIAVYPVVRSEKDEAYISQAISFFLKNDATVYIDELHRDKQYSAGACYASGDDVYNNCDLILVLGGDGSILRAAEIALKHDVPILGINLGRIGYMAELEKDELYLIDEIYKGKYTIEKRMVLSASKKNADGQTEVLGDVLNDVVINRGGYTRTIDIDLYADGRSVRTIRADGLIVATPTGSTAYSMAAGGSVLDPTLECICVTPVCPVSRYACPIVFSGESVIEAEHVDERAEKWSVTIDGEETSPLKQGEKITIAKSEKTVKLLSLKDKSFFETLNKKISKYELKR